MQLFAVTAALFAALAAAGPVARDANTYYKVSKFQAACSPRAGTCNYQFYLLKPGIGEAGPGVFCSATVPQDTTSAGLLPALSGGTCVNSGRTWTVTKGLDDSLTLTAQEQDSVTGPEHTGGGSHTITPKELVSDNTPGEEAQMYKGQTEFDLVSKS